MQRSPITSSGRSLRPSASPISAAKAGIPSEIGPSSSTKAPTAQADGLFKPGQTVGKCVLMEQIGVGATGVVFRAIHKSLNIPVAVKALQVDGLAKDPIVRESFRAEARLLAQLNHPHVVRVWDFDDDGPIPYLVLEHVEGMSLADLIKQSGRLSPERAVTLVTLIAEALAAAWASGIVHRDVKPGNCLLTRDGNAKLADLGLALVTSGPRTDRGESGLDRVEGTAAYMAPEQIQSSSEVDHRADIYSLGATFYHAVTGRLPFTGKSTRETLLMHLNAPLIPACELLPSIPQELSTVIDEMMAKDPEERYQAAQELMAALKRLHSRDASRPASCMETAGSGGIRGGSSTDIQLASESNRSTTQEHSTGSSRSSIWHRLFQRN